MVYSTKLIIFIFIFYLSFFFPFTTPQTPDCTSSADGTCPLHVQSTPSSSCGAEQYLSPTHIVDGFHVLCVSLNNTDDENPLVTTEIYLDGRNKRENFQFTAKWDDFVRSLTEELSLDVSSGPDPSNKYPWAMYTPSGSIITNLEDAIQSKILFIFKGGSFVWPGITVGHTHTVTNLTTLGSTTMTTISMQPLVFELQTFLLKEECTHIRSVAEPHLRPSPVSKMDHDIDKPDTNWRTSHNCFLPSKGDTIMENIDQRVADLTHVHKSHQEYVQVLRYEKSQRYSAHHDFFHPQHYQSEENTAVMRMIEGGRANRLLTVFWYLSDVQEGGETIFPRAGGKTDPVDFNDCTLGLKVKPHEGKAIMFYNMKPNGQFDDFSLHGACPVVDGVKWAANKWVWTKVQRFV